MKLYERNRFSQLYGNAIKNWIIRQASLAFADRQGGEKTDDYFCQEVKKAESLIRVRDRALAQLASEENALKGLSGGTNISSDEKEDHRNVEGIFWLKKRRRRGF